VTVKLGEEADREISRILGRPVKRTGEVRQLLGVARWVLRRWHEQGLCRAHVLEDAKGRHLYYDESALHRARMVMELEAAIGPRRAKRALKLLQQHGVLVMHEDIEEGKA